MREVSDQLCECGCGGFTLIARQTEKRYGYVKGQPHRFIHGHARKKVGPPKTANEKSIESRRRKMERLKRERGAACERCGYNRSLRALDWHHRDPSTKSFTIGSKASWSYERLKEETDKCELWCANCHREEQDGLS